MDDPRAAQLGQIAAASARDHVLIAARRGGSGDMAGTADKVAALLDAAQALDNRGPADGAIGRTSSCFWATCLIPTKAGELGGLADTHEHDGRLSCSPARPPRAGMYRQVQARPAHGTPHRRIALARYSSSCAAPEAVGPIA